MANMMPKGFLYRSTISPDRTLILRNKSFYLVDQFRSLQNGAIQFGKTTHYFLATKNPSDATNVALKDGRYQVWDVKCVKEGQKLFLRNLENKGAINIFRESKECIEVMVESTRRIAVGKLLRERDIPFTVSSERAALNFPSASNSPRGLSPRLSLARPMRIPYNAPKNKQSKQKQYFDWKNYYPLKAIYRFLMDLETKYPSTCTVSSIGKTEEGREIKMLKISNSDATNSGVWIDGTIHAREWISASVVTYIAYNIAKNFAILPKSTTNKDWFFVPVLNPDGYEHSYNGERMWRKNRCRIKDIVCGVDLNRNFGNNWGRVMEYSSNDPNHLNFRGVEPFSEPESAAVKDFILYCGTQFKIFLSFHAYSELISFPWCYMSDPCPDYVSLLEGATVFSKAIYQTTGRMYKVGNFKDLMYSACGTSIDWSYGTVGIPFSYLVELRSKEYKFLLPKDEISDCCKENFNGVLALADFVDKQKSSNLSIDSKKIR